MAARRVSHDAFFLASALDAYCLSHSLDDNQLAAFLGCSIAILPKLGLCRRPDPFAPTFRENVERVAAYAGVAALPLGQLLREADVISVLQAGRGEMAAGTSGLLIAARDAEGEQPEARIDKSAGAREEGQESHE